MSCCETTTPDPFPTMWMEMTPFPLSPGCRSHTHDQLEDKEEDWHMSRRSSTTTCPEEERLLRMLLAFFLNNQECHGSPWTGQEGWWCADEKDLQGINIDGPEDDQGNCQRGLLCQDAGDFWNLQVDSHGRANILGWELREYLFNYFVTPQGSILLQDRWIHDYIHKTRALFKVQSPFQDSTNFPRTD